MNTVAVSQDYQTIPISLLRESPENPRHAFDKTALNELADFVPGNKSGVLWR